jgi:MoaA/NifB/PqqE/SkfB family radical SAM enzyme
MDVNGFHIEPTNICTLKCAGCARTLFLNQWPNHWKNHSLSIEQLLKFLDVSLVDKQIVLCGNYGDPIYHPDFINFVKQLKDRGAHISIITNGSYRKSHWWRELVSILDKKDKIKFSVDGTFENFTEYRVNADRDSILEGMKICSDSTVQTVWKYIPFLFNQETIDEAKKISESIGIQEFQIDLSDRFHENMADLKPADTQLVAQRYSLQHDWRINKPNSVNPQCNNGTQHFVTADGFYSPCCYLADHRFYYKTPFGKNKKQYNISQYTLSEILQKPQVIEFHQTLDQQPGCQFNCPSSAVDQ